MQNWKLTKAKVLAVSLGLMAPAAIWLAQTASAAPTTSLIDRDFEVSLRKFISKRFYNRIDATDEQRQKLDAIWTGTMESTRPLREEVRQSALQLSALIASDDATDEQISQKVQELRALRQKVQDERLNGVLKARKVLTKEQRTQLHDRISELITGGIKPRRVGFLLNQLDQ